LKHSLKKVIEKDLVIIINKIRKAAPKIPLNKTIE